ncbi:C6 zinc finger protein [Colletotrichum scovillei]|uniref:C6 zinc finger protein n=1 Tax=Colletotrichum scovillei TaxID=1209932 RepID=A0A9P7U3S8_9PEZI|nr:C6 zinc finger protein [Colletotrichum scovillei]KAF4775432.1 C6 zinc finger protein [Colletotrichum scovillei]KAG7038812.1 C6 zinc finger protein [Colletotrichum scovillei]KAG7040991.1 C6 zinc finger protein [Colletotrichum scovillei]KAG7061024.1 C6 zinc finger protein [Colletotrichum scovillei]
MNDLRPLITKFALDSKPQQVRASKPKVRSGCVTCKLRRVKCDEGRPACAACLKYQGHCGGYKDNKTKPSKSPPKHRLLYPKPKPEKTKVIDVLLEPNYSTLVFSSQLEKDHFDYWLSFTNTAILFRSDLLTQIIPQLSWNDPAIKHAALAVGAAALGATTREQRLLGRGRFDSDALFHYTKSMNILYSTPMSLERTLTACLLFIIFECFRGNKAAGLNHINHGSRILDQCPPSQGAESSPLLEEVMTSFQYLSLQSWTHGGSHPKETKSRVPWCCRGRKTRYAVDEMPTKFETLEAARRWWNVVRHHVEHHAPLYTGFIVEGSTAPLPEKPPPEYTSPSSQARVRSFVRFTDAWHLAFQPLAVKAETGKETDFKSYYKAISLRIHYLYLWSVIRCAGWTDVEDTKRITPAFMDIISMSRQLLEVHDAENRKGAEATEIFTIEDGPTWPLCTVFLMCTMPGVRHAIVQLFKDFPRRDGLWDTSAFLVIMEWVNTMASTGRITNDQRHVVDCNVVFGESSVTVEKQLWDPVLMDWESRSVCFSY